MKTVLIAHDTAEVRRVLQRMLEQKYSVLIAADATEAHNILALQQQTGGKIDAFAFSSCVPADWVAELVYKHYPETMLISISFDPEFTNEVIQTGVPCKSCHTTELVKKLPEFLGE